MAYDGKAGVDLPPNFDPKRGAKAPPIAAHFRAADDSINQIDKANALGAFAVLQDGVGEVDGRQRQLVRELQELGRDDDPARLGGRRAVGNRASLSPHQLAAKRREESDLRDSVRQAQSDLAARLEAITRRLREIETRLDEIERQIGALDDLDRLAALGQLDVNNPAHLALLRKAGVDLEEIKRRDAVSVLTKRRHDLADERDGLFREKSDLLRERDIQQALQAELERNPDDPAVLAKVRALSQTDTGTNLLGGTAYEASGDEAKIALAQAAASSIEGETLNRRAVANPDANYDTDSAQFDWSKPRPGSPSPGA